MDFYANTLAPATVGYTTVAAPLGMAAVSYFMGVDDPSASQLTVAASQAGGFALAIAAMGYYTNDPVPYSSMEFLVPVIVAGVGAYALQDYIPLPFTFPTGYVTGMAALAYYTSSNMVGTRKFALLGASLPFQYLLMIKIAQSSKESSQIMEVAELSLSTFAFASVLDLLFVGSIDWKTNLAYGIGTAAASLVNNAVSSNVSNGVWPQAALYTNAGVTSGAWLLATMLMQNV